MTDNLHLRLTLEQLKELERQLEEANATELEISIDGLFREADFDLFSNDGEHFITTLLTLEEK